MKQAHLLYNWCFRYNGSTRAAGLMRILFGLLILYRFFLGNQPGIPSYGIGIAILFFLGVFGMIFGLFSRTSTFISACLVLWTYFYRWIHLHDKVWYHHHTYLLGFAVLLLALAPCGKSYSVDRWLAVRKARGLGQPLPPEHGNLFAHRLLAIQLCVLYFYAFWDKAFIAGKNAVFYNFLNGTRLEQIILFNYWGSDFLVQPWMSFIAAAASITVTVLELMLPLLLVEKCQKWLAIPGIGLHIAFYILLPLQTYSLSCIVIYLAIFNADRVDAVIEALGPSAWRRTKQPILN